MLVEWCRVVCVAWCVQLVTTDHVSERALDYEYTHMYTAEDHEPHRERYYLEDEISEIVQPQPDTSEEQELSRVHRYGTTEVDYKQLKYFRNVLKDLLEGQGGVEKFFTSTTFLEILTNKMRSILPTMTESMLEEFLSTLVNDGKPTRSRPVTRTLPTETFNTADDGDILMPRKNGDHRKWFLFRDVQTTTETTTEEETTISTKTTTPWGGCVTRRRRTTTTPSTTPALDIDALLAIIANLTYDYDTNFTRLLDESLKQFSIPTCSPSTTPEPTSLPDYSLYNATVMGKCFVCGLEEHGVPVNAYCADAFAGDFIPLVPVDPKAKGQVSRYRKYCRYRDVHNYVLNESLPRSIFGRWTGGCSVRWIDLSGIYTQRTCRNRHRAVLGRHYGSKRMAKLEMALQHMDNGCIISPMATLVPLSRGISLYARFHACVCTGSWCNWAARTQPCATPLLSLLLTILLS